MIDANQAVLATADVDHWRLISLETQDSHAPAGAHHFTAATCLAALLVYHKVSFT